MAGVDHVEQCSMLVMSDVDMAYVVAVTWRFWLQTILTSPSPKIRIDQSEQKSILRHMDNRNQKGLKEAHSNRESAKQE